MFACHALTASAPHTATVVRRPFLRTLLCIGVLIGGAPTTLAAQSSAAVQACRDAREKGADDALEVCEGVAATVTQQGDAEAAFEALMHSAQLATQRSLPERAEAALAQAEALLPNVRDPLAAHRIARRRGLLDFQRGRSVDALSDLLHALALATAAEDPTAQAVSHNDLGVVYGQLGDFKAALKHYQLSLRARQHLPERDQAATLANIGSLYRQLDDPEQAERYLRRALSAQREADQRIPAARTTEELALLAHAGHQVASARALFDEAWAAYTGADSGRDRMLLALRRAELSADVGDAEDARHWLEMARTEARAIGREVLLRAEILRARLAADRSQRERAVTDLRDALQRQAANDPVLASAAYRQLADTLGELERYPEALQALRSHLQTATALSEAQHDERLDALRVQLDMSTLEAERDHLELLRAQQASEIAEVRVQRLIIGIAALLVVGLLVTFFQRRLLQQRHRAAQAQADLLKRIEHSRQAANALRSDLRSMTWVLDQHAQSVLIFDASGQVRAVTSAAANALEREREDILQRSLTDLFDPMIAAWAQRCVEVVSLADSRSAPPATQVEWRGQPLYCSRIELEEELGVLQWSESRLERMTPLHTSESRDEVSTVVSSSEFRAALVRLMAGSLDLWERITLKSRIELAERSGIWRITIDEGRLRVRAMDRYLSLDTLPEKPRWREVLRTAFFVLAELPLADPQRSRLESDIELIQRATAHRGHPH